MHRVQPRSQCYQVGNSNTESVPVQFDDTVPGVQVPNVCAARVDNEAPEWNVLSQPNKQHSLHILVPQ